AITWIEPRRSLSALTSAFQVACTSAAPRTIAKTSAVMAPSLDLEVGLAGEPGPLPEVGLDVSRELGWRAELRVGAEFDELLRHLRRADGAVHRLVQLGGEGRRRTGGEGDAVGDRALVTRQSGLGDGRDVWCRGRARAAALAERTQLAGLHMGQGGRQAAEIEIDHARHEVGHRRPAALVGHVDDVELAHRLEQ